VINSNLSNLKHDFPKLTVFAMYTCRWNMEPVETEITNIYVVNRLKWNIVINQNKFYNFSKVVNSNHSNLKHDFPKLTVFAMYTCRWNMEPVETEIPTTQRSRTPGQKSGRKGSFDHRKTKLSSLRHDHASIARQQHETETGQGAI